MSTIVERYNKIKLNIASEKHEQIVKIIAVSKTFSKEHIKPLIDYGHQHFGENKVQEAISKWSDIKKENENLKLHMIGKLQNNKAKDAVKLFDYIHSLDNKKLADKLHQIVEGSELKLIESCGHFPSLEQPEILNGILEEITKEQILINM